MVKSAQVHVMDFESAMKESFLQLQEATKTEPTVEKLSACIACLMAAEIISAPKPDLHAQTQQFYKYASMHLKVLKKDLPVRATERIDRMLKALAGGVGWV